MLAVGFVHQTHITENMHNTVAPYRESASAASPVIRLTTAADLQSPPAVDLWSRPTATCLSKNDDRIMLHKNEINSHRTTWTFSGKYGWAGRMCSSLKMSLSDSELQRCNMLNAATVIGQSALLVAPPMPTLVEAVRSADAWTNRDYGFLLWSVKAICSANISSPLVALSYEKHITVAI